MGDNEAAIALLQQAAQREPDSILAQLWLASAQAAGGNLVAARSSVSRIQQLEPDFSVRKTMKYLAPAVLENLQQNLRSAGLN